MRDRQQHETLIATIRGHVQIWRKSLGWSREAAAMEVVEAHRTFDQERATGIFFDSSGPDIFQAAKAAADRIYRWLDDESKDHNLLPANFIGSILLALPVDRRMHCVDDLLRPLGLATRAVEGVTLTPLDAWCLQKMIKESGEACSAVAGLLDGYDQKELLAAQQEIVEAAEVLEEMRRMIEARL